MQMLNYSNAAGISFASLTDGDRWELYEVFKQASLEERRILDLSISDESAQQCALKFLLLWRPNLAGGQPSAASEPVLAIATPPVLAQTAPEAMSEPASEPESILVQTVSGEVTNEPSVFVEPGWIPISQVSRPKKGDPTPSAIRLNRGPCSAVTGWNPALFATAEWLCSQGKLTIQECPIKIIGGTRYIVAVSPEHSNGKDFHYPKQTSTGLYLDLHWDPKDIPRNTQFLLETCGLPSDTVELWFD